MSRYSGISQENGLAEWTNKIKAIQQQVDADEEAEQRKLEEEIQASRLARNRRSRGPAPRTSTAPVETLPTVHDDKPPLDRQKGQADALHKLVGASRPEPISLAQFMGGRATGPRLNKHPPQDTYETTQLAHRSRIPDAPHPVFGRGGVAMPGMVKTESSTSGTSSTEHRTRRLSSPVKEQPQDETRERSISPQKISPRDRTLSTPTPVFTRAEAITPPKSPAHSTTSNGSSPSPAQSTPNFKATSATITHKPPVKPPSLARPVQPDVRSAIKGPQVSISENPSPAFLKPPSQKDPTPSLSRLQGRGFVQSMVSVSKQRESSASPSPTPERPASSGKKSVLERWNQDKTPPKPAAPPPAIRKSWTVDSPLITDVTRSPSSPSSTQSVSDTPPPIIKSKSHTPVLRPQHTPGLGSATTLVLLNPTEDDFPTVDELGQINVATKLSSDFPVSKGKPLAHPTRERAKKPKKSKENELQDVHRDADEDTLTPPAKPSYLISPVASDASSSAKIEVAALKDKWAKQGVIGVKETALDTVLSEQNELKKEPVGRRALPGLVTSGGDGKHSQSQVKSFPALGESQPEPEERKPQVRQRIPSTGNRATVMDVALALNQQDEPHVPSPTLPTSSPISLPISPQPLTAPSVDAGTAPSDLFVKSDTVTPPISPKPVHLRPQPISAAQSERRKSSYEKYSAIILPPLQEETTPVPSPAGSLSRNTGESVSKELGDTTVLAQQPYVHIPPVDDDSPPAFDVEILLESNQPLHVETTSHSISVEVISITHANNVSVAEDFHIFYDTELLAIVHRSKSKASGLASTSVWGWYGKRCRAQESEERKLQDIARRYGTSVVFVRQYSEPAELVKILGGELAIRQGTRAHWSSENTAMHLVRSQAGVIFIDEHDLNVKNLCSGFSYCVSVLGNVYVWHGRGSLPSEQHAARRYAQRLGTEIFELHQGQDDEGEMFWMVLGDEEFAQADYWKWRNTASHRDPKVWQVDSRQAQPIYALDSLVYSNTGIYVFDCVWELFVLVGSEARGNRKDIKLAISFARKVAQHVAPHRPFTPPIHTVILPSQLPTDLRLHFREMDELTFNDDDIPDHMNILSVEEAMDHLGRTRWEAVALKDKTMLPLGLDISACP